MEDADVNGDGRIDYQEFLAATLSVGRLEQEENIYKAFQVRIERAGAQAAGAGWAVEPCKGTMVLQPKYGLHIGQQLACILMWTGHSQPSLFTRNS
jgi:hypothetical protein